jgi:hypothetical protein
MSAFTLDAVTLAEDFFGKSLGQIALDFGELFIERLGGEISAGGSDQGRSALTAKIGAFQVFKPAVLASHSGITFSWYATMTGLARSRRIRLLAKQGRWQDRQL